MSKVFGKLVFLRYIVPLLLRHFVETENAFHFLHHFQAQQGSIFVSYVGEMNLPIGCFAIAIHSPSQYFYGLMQGCKLLIHAYAAGQAR